MKIDPWLVVKRSLLIILPATALLVAITVLIYGTELKGQKSVLDADEVNNVNLIKNIVAADFDIAVSELIFLSEHHELNNLEGTLTDQQTQDLASDYLSFSRRRKIYDQVRFIDHTGMEVVRVNYQNGNPTVVPTGKLQNKAGRYYFKDTFVLNRGEIFVSPLDLNIERGEIELPIKPLIRFGTPVFDNLGNKIGIVVLNYFGSHLLENLDKFYRGSGLIMLLNAQGYWLKGPTPEDEWGFMFEERRDKTFQRMFPDAWRTISTNQSGQLRGDFGLFTFTTVYPLMAARRFAAISDSLSASGNAAAGAEDYYWTVVAQVAPDILSAGRQKLLRAFLPIAIFAFLLLVPGAVYLSRLGLIRKMSESALRVSERRFIDIAENANEWIWEVDANGKYTYASPTITKILGYTSEEMLNRYFYDFFHPDDRETLKQEAFKVFASKGAFREFINRNVHKNGKSVWLTTSGIPVLGKSGELLGYRGADAVKYEESAIIDTLTGVFNRQGLYLLAKQQMKMAIRNNSPIVVLFADMDNLKHINDKFGHAEGDRALKEVAQILQGSVRESDIIARYGGDEFVVLLTGLKTADVEKVVIRHIEEHAVAFNSASDKNYTLSISVGFSTHNTTNIVSIDELILRADKAMYKRKSLKQSIPRRASR